VGGKITEQKHLTPAQRVQERCRGFEIEKKETLSGQFPISEKKWRSNENQRGVESITQKRSEGAVSPYSRKRMDGEQEGGGDGIPGLEGG